MNKYINITILLLIGAYTGFNIFFSFIVAPLLFSHFNHRLAGEITNLIFPYYFASGWIIGVIVYTLIAIKSIKEKTIVKDLKGFLIGLVFLIIFSMALHKTILKIGQETNAHYYQLLDEGKKLEAQKIKSQFKTVHTVSTIINFSNLLIAIYLFVYFYLNTQKTRKKEKII
ncbi:MAG: DUF4149 domain-containing protein [Persephonella sp.]|nr:MAG: DUF4149 domain-containing protein [Persephonella sp.]RUM60951.1 MAG: DUF4149 domain-containing protein [Persephonella sp.]